jgi:hypothetical protein
LTYHDTSPRTPPVSPDGEAGAPEIEITPEMKEAGIEAFCSFDSDDPASWIVIAVYEAMEGARLKSGKGLEEAGCPSDDSSPSS